METKRDDIESQLLGYLADAEKEDNELAQKEAEILNRRVELARTKDSIRNTLQFHLAKTGKEDKGITSEFAAIMSIREAAHLALQKYGEMDKQQLVDRLQQGGFNFGGKKPILTINFATVNDPRITITENGKYQWVENGKPRVAFLSLPKGISKFFVERHNEPASLSEVLEGIKKLRIRTTAKDIKGNVEFVLMGSNKIERTAEGKYRLKQDVYDAMKVAQP